MTNRSLVCAVDNASLVLCCTVAIFRVFAHYSSRDLFVMIDHAPRALHNVSHSVRILGVLVCWCDVANSRHAWISRQKHNRRRSWCLSSSPVSVPVPAARALPTYNKCHCLPVDAGLHNAWLSPLTPGTPLLVLFRTASTKWERANGHDTNQSAT